MDPKTTKRKQDQATLPLLQNRGEKRRTMGTSIKKVQEMVFKIMLTNLQKHHTKVESFNFRQLLLWVFHNVEGVDRSMTQKHGIK